MYRAISSGKIWRGEICNRSKDGRLYWVDTTIVPRMDARNRPTAYYSVRIDITEQKKVQDALDESRRVLSTVAERLETVLANVGEGICMYDAEGRILICNSLYADLYGYAREGLRQGASTADVERFHVEIGKTVPEPDLSDARPGVPKAGLRELPDGRIVAVSRKALEGSNFVSTHRDVSELYRSSLKLSHVARHDPVTGLPNRHYLNEWLAAAAAAATEQSQCALHVIDLDRFKAVNDTYGHPFGDRLLQAVGQKVSEIAGASTLVARLGGDEFAVVQSCIESSEQAHELARTLQGFLNSVDQCVDGMRVPAGASIGTSIAPRDGSNAQHLLQNADLALYQAKASGRATFAIFDPSMKEAASARRDTEAALRQAIEKDSLELHFQPIVALESAACVGAEALLRWTHPTQGPFPVMDLIAIAEETGLIRRIGKWVIERACREAATWGDGKFVAVNVSALQLKEPGFFETIVRALSDAQLAPDRLELEVTETVLIEASSELLETISNLRKLGVRISLDDFGTGYSSMSYLQTFPVDKVKIDRSFVCMIGASHRSLAIVRAINALANALDMTVVVEGIETIEQYHLLRCIGCAEGQGYYFSRPLSAPALHAYFSTQETVGVA